jgi:hypothetical protein
MVAAAAVTYQIKHLADEKLGEVRRLQAEIRLQEQTIDLLEADWALLTQPGRLQELVAVFADDLALETTQPHQIAQPFELPARKLRVEDLLAGQIDGLDLAANDMAVR